MTFRVLCDITKLSITSHRSSLSQKNVLLLLFKLPCFSMKKNCSHWEYIYVPRFLTHDIGCYFMLYFVYDIPKGTSLGAAMVCPLQFLHLTER